MSLETFHQRVSRAIKRGTTFDNDIPGYAKDASRTLENTRNWKHMWVEEEVVLAAGVNSRTITDLKSCEWIKRKIVASGVLIPLKKISPSQILQIAVDTDPKGFWMTSQTAVQFDGAPEADLTLRYGYWLYSDYDDNLPWFDLDEALLLGQTMLEMAPLFKDDKVAARFGPIVAAKIQILRDADIEAEYGGQDQRQIPYADEMEEYLGTGIDIPGA